MKLQDAFAILKPAAPTYQALREAHEDFQRQYADNDALLQTGNAAYSKLLECDVYWFCNFQRYTRDTASRDLVTEIRNVLQQVHALDGLVPVVQGVRVVIEGPCEAVAEELQRLGFVWNPRKKTWQWMSGVRDEHNCT